MTAAISVAGVRPGVLLSHCVSGNVSAAACLSCTGSHLLSGRAWFHQSHWPGSASAQAADLIIVSLWQSISSLLSPDVHTNSWLVCSICWAGDLGILDLYPYSIKIIWFLSWWSRSQHHSPQPNGKNPLLCTGQMSFLCMSYSVLAKRYVAFSWYPLDRYQIAF